MKMLGRMGILGVIATPNVPAGVTEPQMDPRIAKLETFLAPVGVGPVRFDSGQMAASLRHGIVLIGFRVEESTLSNGSLVG